MSLNIDRDKDRSGVKRILAERIKSAAGSLD